MKKKIPLVSIVTVNYNGKKFLKDCFDSLLALNYPKNRLEVIMIDNCSQDDSIDYVKKQYPRIKVFKNNINNYCRANNLGIAKSKGDYIAILNNDTKVDKNWLIELIKVIIRDDKIGAVGSKILFMDGRIQSVGHVELPHYNWGDRGLFEEDRQQYNQIMEVQSISNCSALYRRKALNKVGMFDEDFNMYMEDVDMAFRLRRKGWKILFVPTSIAYHKLHGSQQTAALRQFHILKNRLLFIAKHFPDKLSESLCGFGEITKLAYTDFQKILISVFNKLLMYQKVNKAMKIMLGLQKSIELIDEYHQHCFRVELEKRTTDIQQQLQARDKQIVSLNELIQVRDKQIQSQDTGLRIRDEQINIKNRTITEKTDEIYKIYNSETYRLIVRPIIWPCLSFVKKIKGVFLVLFNAASFISRNHRVKNKDTGICVASLYAKNAIAKYMQDNEYFIKLVNNKYTEDKITLVIDIWPYHNSYHPQRHFANFSIELTINPKNSKLIKMIYNWEKDVVFFVNNHEVNLNAFWRGEMKSFELYLVFAYISNLEGEIFGNRLNILQRLE